MYDLLVLALNEKKPSFLHFEDICLKALNRTGKKKAKYYYEIWPFINNAYGILYKLFTNDGLGKFECCDEMFEFNTVEDINFTLPYSFTNLTDDIIGDNVSMMLTEEYDKEFMATLDMILSFSPISTIAFLCRGQSYDKEIILGTLSISDFKQMLRSGQIQTNICYIITH